MTRQCLLLAQSGHPNMLNQCPLLGVSQTLFALVPVPQSFLQFLRAKNALGVNSGVNKSAILQKAQQWRGVIDRRRASCSTSTATASIPMRQRNDWPNATNGRPPTTGPRHNGGSAIRSCPARHWRRLNKVRPHAEVSRPVRVSICGSDRPN